MSAGPRAHRGPDAGRPWNNGRVFQNNGRVFQNNGLVFQNNGLVFQNNGRVFQNNGRVSQNNGCVSQNDGCVSQNDISQRRGIYSRFSQTAAKSFTETGIPLALRLFSLQAESFIAGFSGLYPQQPVRPCLQIRQILSLRNESRGISRSLLL